MLTESRCATGSCEVIQATDTQVILDSQRVEGATNAVNVHILLVVDFAITNSKLTQKLHS